MDKYCICFDGLQWGGVALVIQAHVNSSQPHWQIRHKTNPLDFWALFTYVVNDEYNVYYSAVYAVFTITNKV